ncbi:GPR1/FUN34/yaaH family [Strigomonas culicis]|uniref:GPR1/FUN34/yaaH family n=1 Tax=Strigomonas culicis TaxID=28005 RepID=S9WLK0_9TRYP|nr:GPR1/FUN34/yaaH family [Strigomonas culicis]|eukprot:EPY36865.1 GPR1/FUN34/yaaH family [Strigomonas culicis]
MDHAMRKDDGDHFPTAAVEIDQGASDDLHQSYFERKNKAHTAPRKLRKVVYYYEDSEEEGQEEDGAVMDVDTTRVRGGATNNEPTEAMVPVRARRLRGCPAAVTVRLEPPPPVSVENPRIGSPTPIGFFAFGLTTALFNVHNAKICPLNTSTMGLVIFYGGLTQFICGFLELVNRNTFGCTISTTYGAFWLATAALFMIDVNGNNQTMVMANANYTGGYFLFWFFFAGTLFCCSIFAPLMCTLLMFLVPLNFFMQSISFFTGSVTLTKVAGYEGIIVGCLAFYLGMAFTFEDVYKRRILPVFSHDRQFRNWKW